MANLTQKQRTINAAAQQLQLNDAGLNQIAVYAMRDDIIIKSINSSTGAFMHMKQVVTIAEAFKLNVLCSYSTNFKCVIARIF